jgi:MFS family permease
MAISLLFMAACFYSQRPRLDLAIVSVLSYIAFFAFGMAPAMWTYISEIFPNLARGVAMSMATVSMWSATLVVTLTFLSITQRLGISGAFLIYAGFSLASFAFVLTMVPETKGKTLEDIQHYWSSFAKIP